MDVYSLTRKQRPSHPTIGGPAGGGGGNRSIGTVAGAATASSVEEEASHDTERHASRHAESSPMAPAHFYGPTTGGPSSTTSSSVSTSRAASIRSSSRESISDEPSSVPGKLIRTLSSTLLRGWSPSSPKSTSPSLDPRGFSSSRIDAATPPPSRAHWRPDHEVTNCVACDIPFTFLERRHHCRKCGNIFCNSCTATTARLDESGQFHEHGHLVRVCKGCMRSFSDVHSMRAEVERLREHKWHLERERDRKEKSTMMPGDPSPMSEGGIVRSSSGAGGRITPLSGTSSAAVDINAPPTSSAPKPDLMAGIGSLGSVPTDWNWSTF